MTKNLDCHDLPNGKSRNDDLFFYKSADSRNDEKFRLPQICFFYKSADSRNDKARRGRSPPFYLHNLTTKYKDAADLKIATFGNKYSLLLWCKWLFKNYFYAYLK